MTPPGLLSVGTRRARRRKLPCCWDLGLGNRSPKSKFTTTPLMPPCLMPPSISLLLPSLCSVWSSHYHLSVSFPYQRAPWFMSDISLHAPENNRPCNWKYRLFVENCGPQRCVNTTNVCPWNQWCGTQVANIVKTQQSWFHVIPTFSRFLCQLFASQFFRIFVF